MSERVCLVTRMNFQAARDLHAQLSALGAGDVEVDASPVEFLGGLAAQTLIAGQRHWQRGGHRFDIVAPSDGFQTSLAELGLADMLAIRAEGT